MPVRNLDHSKPNLLLWPNIKSGKRFEIKNISGFCYQVPETIKARVFRVSRNFEFKAIQFVEWRCWCFTCCSSSLYPGRLTLANPQAFWWRERISFKDSVWNTALDGQQSFVLKCY
ncbi:hypothetical protein PanWU01x14_291450 [Parasponia andersonii]|uniref:Uncharacterized protein n=1 Tax=Parasponia andersonii TaxID=3476 RepID=A0A2P5AXB0_PARAD|nr:hypothetical protein PanWU01x14_291450 [Parasponia andersonii]